MPAPVFGITMFPIPNRQHQNHRAKQKFQTSLKNQHRVITYHDSVYRIAQATYHPQDPRLNAYVFRFLGFNQLYSLRQIRNESTQSHNRQ